MSSEPLLIAESLTKDYGSFRALDSFRLSLQPGEVFGLLGPNGSGKSTAIRMLLGFMQPTMGRASIAGFDCWEQSIEVRKRVAYLPGELRLYENMTGRQLVRFLYQLRGESMNGDVDPLARRLDINLDKPLTQMSSGMKRKVALLTVLLPQVPLIILDEPTNTLDPVMRDELLEQLKLAKQRGQTILFSSHVLTEVEQVCDRVGILRQGVLVHLQEMRDLQKGRSIRGRFTPIPERGPDGEPLNLRSLPSGEIELEYTGPLPKLLTWLQQTQVSDLRVEPMGLSPIYHRYHGASA